MLLGVSCELLEDSLTKKNKMGARLQTQGRVLLLEDDVPDIEGPVQFCCEENGGSGRAPATVSQVRHVVSAATRNMRSDCHRTFGQWRPLSLHRGAAYDMRSCWPRYMCVDICPTGSLSNKCTHLLGPHDGGLSNVLGPDPGRPVPDAEEVFGKERVSLDAVDGAVVTWVHRDDFLGRSLRFTVARHDDALLRTHHELGWLSESKFSMYQCAQHHR